MLDLEHQPLDATGITILPDGEVVFQKRASHRLLGAGAPVSEDAEEADEFDTADASDQCVGLAASRSVYYVDPAFGSMAYDGRTRATAWSTLAEVMRSGKTFAGGDVIVLLRGYHGAPKISGVNSSDVVIRALPGHTPLVRSLVFHNATHWDVGSIVVTASATPRGHPDEEDRASGVDLTIATSSAAPAPTCSYITLRDTSLYSVQDSSSRTARQWQAASTGIAVYATNYSLINCHVYNGGGIQLGYHSHMGRVVNCVIENFSTDGAGLKAGNVLFAGNCIYGSHKVNGNHNDLFQCWAASNVVFKHNFLAAYVNPAQRFTVAPFVSDCQGMGGYDGWKRNWLIQGNVVKVDHPIGIWHLGVKPNMVIVHNTVVRCGSSLAIGKRRPCIHVEASKSGAPSSGAYVANNLCESYELTSGIELNRGNMTVAPGGFHAMFVDWGRNDLRLRPGCSAVGKGTTSLPAFIQPSTDQLGSPYVDPKTKLADCGAFAVASSSGAAASAPWIMRPAAPFGRDVVSATLVPGLGVDVAWNPVAGDKSFVVMFDGKKVGTVRTGLGVFFWLRPDATLADALTTRFSVSAVPTASF